MATATQSSGATETRNLTKVQKLAIFLVMIGPESAAQVLKNLDDHELEAVSAEMAKQTTIPHELQTEILTEFNDVALQATTSLRGGLDYTQTALEKAVGIFKASSLLSRVAPARAPLAAMQEVMELEPRQIVNLVKLEQPQTIALIVSYLPPEMGSQVLSMLREELREQVIERLATLGATPAETMDRVIKVINQRLKRKQRRALSQTGGVKCAADLLNALSKEMTQTILDSINVKNPELGAAIRQKMFTFEDLLELDNGSLQKVMREVDMRDLALALKTASDELKGALLGAISKRAAETVREEMSFMGPVKLKEVEAAQLRVIETVRRLESDGEVDLGCMREEADAFVA